MKKVIISGSEGFVGQHLVKYLLSLGTYTILGLGRSKKIVHYVRNYKYVSLDLNDSRLLDDIVEDFKPEYIIHLAAFSSVSLSWKEPADCFKNNTDIFINILESVKKKSMKTKIISIGSSEEYGNINPTDIPVSESTVLKPLSPYAVARVSQEMLSKVYIKGFGLNIVMTRSFNHFGPGQSTKFAIPSFINKLNCSTDYIEVGDLSIIRDFTDVRDVVVAYEMLLRNGKNGEVYNVCSGRGIELSQIVELAKDKLNKKKVEIKQSKDLIRPTDIPVMIGSNEKIKYEIGWVPKINIDESINDLIFFLRG